METAAVQQTVIGDHNLVTVSGNIRINYQLPPVEAEERRILLQLTESVKQFWVAGVLERSVHEAAMVELRKEAQPEAVENPWARLLALPGEAPQALGVERKIGEVFTTAGRLLLILGEPGAGKTVTLLELARDLIVRFENDPTQGAPVVLNLSTWTEKRDGLGDWIEAEMKGKYFVPLRRTRAWLGASRLLLLLDGLDEVPAENRAACVHAINAFLENSGAPGVAVCSRRAEYLALTERLHFRGAICLQPLAPAQIDEYLARGGTRLYALRETIHRDPLLAEMARSPLMLNVITLALLDSPNAEPDTRGDTVEARRTALFERYVQRMFQRAGRAPAEFPEEGTHHWLSWLASQMRAHSQTIFLIENLQPDWLPTSRERWSYALRSRFAGSLLWAFVWWFFTILFQPGVRQWILEGTLFTIIGGTIAGALAGLSAGHRITSPARMHGAWMRRAIFAGNLLLYPVAMGAVFALLAGPFFEPLETFLWSAGEGAAGFTGVSLGFRTGVRYGLIFGVVFALRHARRSAVRDILLSDTLRANWKAVGQTARRALIWSAWLSLALAFFYFANEWAAMLRYPKWMIPLGFILAWLILFLSFGFFFVFLGGLFTLFTPGDLPTKTHPGKWLKISAQNALFAGGISGAGYGTFIALSLAAAHHAKFLSFGAMAGAAVGIAAAMWYGGFDVIQHLVLRSMLRRRGRIPVRYAEFLDHAARLIFLQKVGPGYIFMHRQLLDHFADQAPRPGA